MGTFSPSLGEILGVQNGLTGWEKVFGLGPNYFAPPAVEHDLLRLIATGKRVSPATRKSLALGRARTVNFFALIDPNQPFNPRAAGEFRGEVNVFLRQLNEQASIWRESAFRALDFDHAEVAIFNRVAAKCSTVMFNMGFADATPHSNQVSRLAASMEMDLGGRPSQVLQSAITGLLHDPKFHPILDVSHQNLATHPIVAAALAYTLLRDPEIGKMLLEYLGGNLGKREEFIAGIVDTLAINDDSRFVQMMKILKEYTELVGNVFAPQLADDLKIIMEERLESASKGYVPPELPEHLYGCLAQFRLDSGVQGISQKGWCEAVSSAGIRDEDPLALFNRIIDGESTGYSLEALKAHLLAVKPDAIIKAQVMATTLLHHHHEVMESARLVSASLVIADPMMLSPHKVAAVYDTPIVDRLASFVKSFDDNIRLLPKVARANGWRWQRAVYLSMLTAADRLNGSALVGEFKAGHRNTSVRTDIEHLRTRVVDPKVWGTWGHASGTAAANDDVHKVLKILELAYRDVLNQFRKKVLTSKKGLNKFYPTR